MRIFLKNFLFIFSTMFLLLSCVSKPEKQQETVIKVVEELITEPTSDPVMITEVIRTGFRYDVPDDMEEAPAEAKLYRFNNLLVDKGKKPHESSRIIAIRHISDFEEYGLLDFAQMDQKNFYTDKYAVYEKGWDAPGLEEKAICHISYDFTYIDRTIKVFQRSVYIEFDGIFYIISLSSLAKSNIIDEKNNLFWRSIRVD